MRARLLIICGVIFLAGTAMAILLAGRPKDEIRTTAQVGQRIKSLLDKSGYDYSFYFDYSDQGEHPAAGGGSMVKSASLIKLPKVMELYRSAEENKIDPNTTVSLQPDWLDQNYGSLWQEGAGAKISYEEAARLAITQSDNTAIKVVDSALAAAPPSVDVLASLHFQYKTDATGMVYTNAASYADVMRCLYLGCYLNSIDSNKLLQQMTETDFPGIVEGVPKGTTVAHKIGETPTSYADCGIIYFPEKPYTLYVMIGADRLKALPLIAEVSRMAYDSVKAGASTP